MSNPSRAPGDGKDGDKNEIEKTVAKTAGFVVFSGIAMSILKALNPFNNNNQCSTPNIDKTQVHHPPPCCQSSQQQPLQEPIFQDTVTTSVEQNVAESTAKTIEIVKGDTLWGLSREYGVSIDAIKEANGLTGDTIYAGKKLIIP